MKRLIICIALLLPCAAGLAQEKYFFFALDVNKPLSNTSFIENTSAYGFKAGYRAFISRKFSAGLDLGSSTLQQYKPTETYQTGNGALTTDYFNYIYSYSAAISGQYNLEVGNGETLFPYVGLGLGANTNQYSLYYNAYSDSDRGWGFLARPEAGLLVKIGRRGSFGAMAAVHYDYSTNKSEKFSYSNFSTIGVQVGLILMEL